MLPTRQFINVEYTQNGISVKNKINGSLTNDTLNVVSPSTHGTAFVPTLLVNNNRRNEGNPEINFLEDMRGDERKNIFGHLYDNYSSHTPNQGYNTINNWFNSDGQDAVHTRILGLGKGIKNADGSWEKSGFKLSDNGKKATIIAANYKSGDSNDYFKELGLDAVNDLDTTFFITNVIFSDTNTTINVSTTQPDTLSNIKITANDINSQNNTLSLDNIIEISKPESGVGYADLNTICAYEKDIFHYAAFPLLSNPDQDSTITHNAIKIEGVDVNNLFDSFEDKYQTARTPWVTSQPVDRNGLSDNRENIHEKVVDLFRFWALDDGEIGNRFRIKINPKAIGNKDIGNFSTFDIHIFEYEPRNNTFTRVESYTSVDLDVNSENYIGRKIGDKYSYYDPQTKKIYHAGTYDNVSEYIRVEIKESVEFNQLSDLNKIVPSGFRSYPRINTDKLSVGQSQTLKYLPPKVVMTKLDENFGEKVSGINNSWGIQFYYTDVANTKYTPSITAEDTTISQSGKSELLSPHYFYGKYFSSFKENQNGENLNVWIEDDNYLNSFFHLEKISFVNTNNNTNNTNAFKYRPSGRSSSLNSREYIKIEEEGVFDNNTNGNKGALKEEFNQKLSFDFFTYGGFDGTNIFDFEKKNMTDEGLMEEYYTESLKKESPIYNCYKTGIDLTTNYENCNGDILVVPDVSLLDIHRYCVDICETTKRYMYFGDVKGIYYDFIQRKSLFNDDVEISTEISTEKYKLDSTQTFSGYDLDMIEKEPYNFSAIEKLLENIYNLNLSHGISSRYFVGLLGEFNKTFENNIFFESVCSQICKVLPNNFLIDLSNLSIKSFSESGIECFDIKSESIDINGLSENGKDTTEFIKSRLTNNLMTGFAKQGNYFVLSNQLTAHSLEYSVFSEIRYVRTIQLIKKLIMVSIFTDETFVNGTFFFNNSSKYKNIYQLLKIQLNTLLNDLQTAGLISGFKVNIDENFIENNKIEMQNYKFSGNIVIQFGDSSIIELDINNTLAELSLLSAEPSNESGYSAVNIPTNNF